MFRDLTIKIGQSSKIWFGRKKTHITTLKRYGHNGTKFSDSYIMGLRVHELRNSPVTLRIQV